MGGAALPGMKPGLDGVVYLHGSLVQDLPGFRVRVELGFAKRESPALFDNLITTNDDKIYVQQMKLWAPLGITGPATMFLDIPASYSLNNLLNDD
jgi:hypothetical protein